MVFHPQFWIGMMKRREDCCLWLILKKLNLGLLLLLFSLLITLFSNVHAQSDGIVETDCGPIQGAWDKDQDLWVFKGIPYAVPPLGKLRWQPPLAPSQAQNTCWNGTFQASNYGSECVQASYVLPFLTSGNEDCLYLNVWTSSLPSSSSSSSSSSLKPVMVFIHGGSLIGGSGSLVGSIPWRLANTGEVVAVTLNYRLNAFGFLALKVLSENDPRGVSGNLGFMDQMLALKWIQNNIKAFGGDPSLVTVYGQSSGGTSLFALMISPLAAGLFQRAISMSGSPAIVSSLEQAEEYNLQNWLPMTRCNNTPSSELLKCLYSLSTDEIFKACPTNWAANWPFSLPSPSLVIGGLAIVDGVVVPNNSTHAFGAGLANDLPIIFGVMAQEPDLQPEQVVIDWPIDKYEQLINQTFNAFVPGLGDQVLSLYPTSSFLSTQQSYDSIVADIGDGCGNLMLARLAASQFSSPVYAYSGVQLPQQQECFTDSAYCSRYSFHCYDLWTMFNEFGPLWELKPNDIAFGELVMKRFIEFAFNGTISSSPAWKPINSAPGFPQAYYSTLLSLNESLALNHKQEECDFWAANGFSSFWWQN